MTTTGGTADECGANVGIDTSCYSIDGSVLTHHPEDDEENNAILDVDDNPPVCDALLPVRAGRASGRVFVRLSPAT